MKSFKLQIVTPDGMYYDGECTEVNVKSTEGGVAILAGHIPLVTTLAKDGWCKVRTESGKRTAYCSGGMMTVTRELTRIVAASFQWDD